MKLKLKKYLYIAAMLCMAVSCKKDPPPDTSCNNGTCCGQGKDRYKFIKVIENAPADYAASSIYPVLNLKDPIVTSSGDVYLVPICDLSTNTVQSMNLTNTYFINKTPTYQYRIWGKLYDNLSATSFGPPYHAFNIFIDKIEKIP
jgi:hypothetical protein